MAFPVDLTNRKYNLEWLLRTTAVRINKVITNKGQINIGTATNNDWRTSVKPTIVSNAWNAMDSSSVLPSAGRARYVYKITVETTDDCTIGIRHREESTLYSVIGDSGVPLLDGVLCDRVLTQSSTTGGTVVFDFSDAPLKVKYKESLLVQYYKTSTTGTNWCITFDQVDVTNDENFNAPFFQGVLGDSICITSDTKELEYSNRDGVIHGAWPIIVNEHLKANGIECLLNNIGIGGTNILYWDNKISIGLFRNWLPDVLFINCGINDAGSIGSITTTSEGWYKKCVRNITNRYFKLKPNGCIIMNQITDTDTDGGKQTIVGSGPYTGLTQIAALRLELIAVVAELKLANPTWDLHIADTSPAQTFLASEKTNYLTAEQSANLSIHPNNRIGQPKMAVKIIEKLNTTQFYLKYKTT